MQNIKMRNYNMEKKEQPTSPMNPAPPAQNEPKKSGLMFLGVGLIEVFSVIFALLLIFGTLNYFGLLPVSESFPFLSFLPQKQKIITNKTVKTGTPKSPTGVAAIVNGQQISLDEFNKQLTVEKYEVTNIIPVLTKQAVSADFINSLPKTVLDNLILETLLTKHLAQKGIIVTDEEVRQKIQKDIVETNWGGDWQKYETALANTYHSNLENITHSVRRDLLIKKTFAAENFKPIQFDQWYNTKLRKTADIKIYLKDYK